MVWDDSGNWETSERRNEHKRESAAEDDAKMWAREEGFRYKKEMPR